MEGGGAGAPQPQLPASPTAGRATRPSCSCSRSAFGLFPQVSATEFTQIEVARVLIPALLPSDRGVRFGRAPCYRSGSTPQPGSAQLTRI